MPELPEVETIKNELEPVVIGKRIEAVTILWDRMVRQPSAAEFRSLAVGRRIVSLSRRGKYLIFHLSGGKAMLIHLKMSGSLLLRHSRETPDKHVRVLFRLNGEALHFRDPRKFGKMWLVDDENEIVGKLGPEPLDERFTPEVLADILSKRKAPVKALLCDQSLIAGIGNMYADEALFRAKIHPLRPGNSLRAVEIKRLHNAVREVLTAGIKAKGASVVNYFRPDGSSGSARDEFKVAHRGGMPCPICGRPVVRIVVRQRGTYFCPRCQR